jgi:hypothetical protein
MDTDSDPDPPIFVSDLQDVKKELFFQFRGPALLLSDLQDANKIFKFFCFLSLINDVNVPSKSNKS